MTNRNTPTPSNSVVTEAKQMIARIVGAIDDDLERQADIQTGCDYWRTDECGVASADMNIVTSELASAIYLAMQSANTTGSDELVERVARAIEQPFLPHGYELKPHLLKSAARNVLAIATPDTDAPELRRKLQEAARDMAAGGIPADAYYGSAFSDAANLIGTLADALIEVTNALVGCYVESAAADSDPRIIRARAAIAALSQPLGSQENGNG